MDRTHILYVLHIGRAFDPGLLPRLTQDIGVHKLARLLHPLPIEEEDHLAGIVNAMKNAECGFACLLAGIEVRIERLLPAVVVRHLVEDQHMHHESASQSNRLLQDTESPAKCEPGNATDLCDEGC